MTNYIVIQSWMTDESGMNLSGNELLVYAVIYGFSQDGGTYYAKREYIGKLINIKRLATITDIIKRLIEKGYVEKIAEGKQEGYRAITPDNLIQCSASEDDTETVPQETVRKAYGTVRKAYGKSTESVRQEYGNRTQINNYINNYINKYIKGNPPEELRQLIRLWFEYRQGIKKAINNDKTAEQVIDKFTENFKKFGYDKVKGVIDYSISNNYQGLFWERLQSKDEPTKNTSSYDISKYSKLGLNLTSKPADDFDILGD